jgi:hypothetical protein
MTLSGGVFNSWLIRSSLIEFGLVPSPNSLKWILGLEANWSIHSSKIDIFKAELNEENGYSRQDWQVTANQFVNNTVNKRIELDEPYKWQITANGLSLQWDSFALVADPHHRANAVLENINASTNSLTLTEHELNDGDEILLTPDLDAVLPTGIPEDTIFYVVNSDPNTLQISETINGTALNFLDSGTGDIRLRYANGHLIEGAINSEAQTIIAGTTQDFLWDYKKLNTQILTGNIW